VKGGGFFRRAGAAALGLLSMGGISPRPLAVSNSSVRATAPTGQTKAPTSQVTASQQQVRHIRSKNVYHSYLSSRVIPPFKFCHGRTMVARYPRVQGS
jgi:hypothetical protein